MKPRLHSLRRESIKGTSYRHQIDPVASGRGIFAKMIKTRDSADLVISKPGGIALGEKREIGSMATDNGQIQYAHAGSTVAFHNNRRLETGDLVNLKHGDTLTFGEGTPARAHIIVDAESNLDFKTERDALLHAVRKRR